MLTNLLYLVLKKDKINHLQLNQGTNHMNKSQWLKNMIDIKTVVTTCTVLIVSLATASSAVSGARLISFTADAEIQP